MADISVDVILGMPILTLSNPDIQFADQELIWRSYNMAKALATIQQVEIFDKKEFAKRALDKNVEAFVIYVASLSLGQMTIHLAWEAQFALLVVEEVIVIAEYSDIADVFLKKSAAELSKRFDINKHSIKAEPRK